MAEEIGRNSAMNREKWPLALAHTMTREMFWDKFMGEGDGSIIKKKMDLTKESGDKINMELAQPIEGDSAEGNTRIEGDSRYETALSFATDAVEIDFRRKTVKKYGKMTDQRVPYNLRNEGKNALGRYFGEDTDQIITIYLSGARGVNSDFKVPTTFSGRANNSIQAPDSSHIYYGGGFAKATLTTANKMTRTEIEAMAPRARLLNPMIQPVSLGSGKKKYVFLMSEEQAFDLRTGTSDGDWLDIAKRNDAGKIYDGSLGEINNVILHAHANVIKFSDYGAAGTMVAARALLLGASAGVIAWGKGGASGRFDWNEETEDRGAGLAITAGHVWGCKKVRYVSEDDGVSTDGDYGVIALDTYYTDLIN